MTPRDLASQLQTHFGDLVGSLVEFRGEATLTVREARRIPEVCEFARTALDCDLLLDISSIDNYGEDPRWTIVYELYSLKHRAHLRLKTCVSEEQSELPTLTRVWPVANWHEREIYDMMGIRFSEHPDLRRILMWEGYPHFPLRKDFPLAGRTTDSPEVAFTEPAPMEGGPFVTTPGQTGATEREPRARANHP